MPPTAISLTGVVIGGDCELLAHPNHTRKSRDPALWRLVSSRNPLISQTAWQKASRSVGRLSAQKAN
jgi:hypothetical protein